MPASTAASTSNTTPTASGSPVLGIDLGTTNSLVAVADPSPRIISDGQGRAMLPSVVRFDVAARAVELGYEARASAIAHPRLTISSVKRLMGRTLEDAASDLGYLSYQVVAGENGSARVALPGAEPGAATLVSPQEVSSIILRRLREQAEAALGTACPRAVVTVPAYFDDAQRQATREAGRLAGLDVVRIINEPTAAALAYGLGLRHAASEGAKPQTIAVYDLGGGTFDVSIMRITRAKGSGDQGIEGSGGTTSIPGSHDPSIPSVSDYFQVLSTAGDTHLGGDDFDQALIGLFTAEIRERFRDVSFPPATRQALSQFAEAAKVRLSDQERVVVRIALDEARTYERAVSRDEFEALVEPLVERTLAACARALRDAKRQMDGDPVSAVVLVGGATRTPLVRRKVREFFGLEPYTALDPDQVVALGAAVQARVLSGETAGAGLLLDVVPLSLGIETVGGAMAKLVMRNSTVPARAREMFSTSVDNQTGVKLHVLQGEREMAADCRSLARLELSGIPPMPAGIPKLEVTFSVDASGILTVQAIEQRSGKRLSAQIVPNHGLTQAEVDRIERDSLTHARADMRQHRVTDLVANAKLDSHWIRRQLDRLGSELPGELRADVEARLTTLATFIERGSADWSSVDADAFNAARDALDRASVRVHEIAIAKSLREER